MDNLVYVCSNEFKGKVKDGKPQKYASEEKRYAAEQVAKKWKRVSWSYKICGINTTL